MSKLRFLYPPLAAIAFSSIVFAAITLETNFPQATLGQPYTYNLAPAGGSAPYAFAMNSGSLPLGLTLSPTGTLAGTPLNAGQYSFAILTSDSTNANVVSNITLKVNGTSGLTVTNTAMAPGRINTPYDLNLTAQGGSAPYSWDLAMGGGSLPAGLTLSNQGRLSGTPTAGGIYPLTLRVTDSSGNSYRTALVLTVEVTTLTITTTSLSGASTNVPYSQGLSAIGGTSPYTFSMLSGALPAGLTLSSGGVISGSPTTSGTSNFVVRVADSATNVAQGNFSIVVTGSGLGVVISSLPTGTLNQPYNASFTGQGGTSPYTFSITNGTLPAGLTLNLNGTITGMPTATGVFPVTVRVGDAASQSAQTAANIIVNSSAFSFTTSSASDASLTNNYSLNLATSSGMAPITYTLLSGNLPAGITLSPTGSFSGMPTTIGTSSFVIRATDASGATAQLPLTIRTNPAPGLAISALGVANGQLGQAYTSTLSASGGASPYTFNLVTGSLPPGLTLSSNGNISGTPTTGGLYQITYRVIDSNQKMAEATLPIYISGGIVNVTNLVLPAGRPNQAYTSTLAATGGSAPYNFQVTSGSLPTGLTLSPGGILSGTLTQTTNGAFTVRVTDASGATSLVSYLFNVNSSAMGLTANAPATGMLGQLYSTKLTTTGGSGASTFALDSGALPTGLTLASDGTLSGTPTAAGTFVFNIKATDAANATATFSQAITIGAAQFGFANTNLPNVSPNTPYTFTFNGINGIAPYSFALVSGNLPSGLTLASGGALTGTTTATGGAFPVTIRITDATGATATSAITLNVGTASTFAITTVNLASASTTQAYNIMVVASGGSSPYTFQLASGSLPTGLTLAPSGTISGTATANGPFTFTLRATDAAGQTTQKMFTLTVGSSTLNIANAQFSNGIVGRLFTSPLTASGGQPGYTFSLLSGTLPPGLSFASTGILSGMPTTVGSFPVVIRVTDSASTSVDRNFNIIVSSSDLAFTDVSLPSAYIGQNYRANIQAAAGTQPFTFSIVSGSLPAGLTLSPGGLISGSPTTAGQSTVTFRVTDATGKMSENTLSLGVIQSAANFSFTSIPNGIVGQPYRFTPTGSGSGGFIIVVGGLPPGLVATERGDIAGVPTREGTYFLTLRTQNGSGESAISSFPITISGAGFRIANTTLPSAELNRSYTQTLTGAGGNGATTFVVQSGALPPGITLTPAGVLSGTATTAGNYTFTIRATDASNATTSSTYTFAVTAPEVNFVTSTLPSGTLNQAYNQTLMFSGGTAPYTVTVTNGTLPTGLSISPAGVISGMPTAAVNSPFTLRVTDSTGKTSTAEYLIGIGVVGAPALGAIVSAANYLGDGVAPGEIVVIYGTNLGPANLLSATVSNNAFATTFGGTRVLFDGTPAPIVYTSATQVAVVAPFNLMGKTSTRISVESLGVTAAQIQVPVRAARPSIFTANASGTGPGAILNQNASVNTAQNPAEKQTIISVYVTGVGQTSPASVDGQIVSTQSTLVTPVTATINGQTAEVIYAGGAPGLIPGLAQINLRLPANTISGPNSIQLTSGATTTTGNVTVFVR